ncbi:hypothetical protein [uncultured Psychromonas sp.]|uniref:hypothetical protein n=1 Tax=uncultured Psychromonas sp. TaxID=173974 RepID=UPI00261290CB|nr:hypothetical protein [uncultured Psychromonas sp.]
MNKILFTTLAKMKVRELQPRKLSSLSAHFPNNSKVLYRIITRDILKQEGILLTVITGHLYKDYILGLILNKEGIDTEQRHFQSFSKK